MLPSRRFCNLGQLASGNLIKRWQPADIEALALLPEQRLALQANLALMRCLDAQIGELERAILFDPLILHLKGNKVFAARSETIDDMPRFRAPDAAPGGATCTAGAAGNGAADGPNARAPVAAPTVDELIRIAVDDLITGTQVRGHK